MKNSIFVLGGIALGYLGYQIYKEAKEKQQETGDIFSLDDCIQDVISEKMEMIEGKIDEIDKMVSDKLDSL